MFGLSSSKGRPVTDPNVAWSREKLLLLVAGVVLAVVVVLVGLVLAIYQATRPSQPATATAVAASTTAPVSAGNLRDAAAAAPMPPRTGTTAALVLPESTVLRGPGGVASGFPHTQEGALAQLAAIDQLVLTTMRPALTQDVYRAWALPGGVGADQWLMTRNVTSFTATLARAGGDTPAQVTATPAAGLVKASDGPDWLVACVLLDVRATVKTQARMGYGHCERMQWSDGRWLIAPGNPPTQPAPITPGDDAAAAGWRTVTTTP